MLGTSDSLKEESLLKNIWYFSTFGDCAPEHSDDLRKSTWDKTIIRWSGVRIEEYVSNPRDLLVINRDL